jgi:hypothetical protein
MIKYLDFSVSTSLNRLVVYFYKVSCIASLLSKSFNLSKQFNFLKCVYLFAVT